MLVQLGPTGILNATRLVRDRRVPCGIPNAATESCWQQFCAACGIRVCTFFGIRPENSGPAVGFEGRDLKGERERERDPLGESGK